MQAYEGGAFAVEGNSLKASDKDVDAGMHSSINSHETGPANLHHARCCLLCVFLNLLLPTDYLNKTVFKFVVQSLLDGMKSI